MPDPKAPKLPKTKPPVIDRTRYESILNKPFANTGQDSMIAQGGYGSGAHSNLLNEGATLLSGTPGSKNAAYIKNGRLLLAHSSGQGFSDVGEYTPEGKITPSTTQPIIPPIIKDNTPNPIDKTVLPTVFGTAGTYNPNTDVNKNYQNEKIQPIVEQYKKGGLVGKIKRYANGGEVDPQFQQFDPSNPIVTSAASTGLNTIIPGAGTALGVGVQAKDSLTSNLSQIDPATGKYKNKNNAYGAGWIDSLYKATPMGMAQTALDPNKDFGEKALSIGTLGIADLIGTKKKVDNMQNANTGIFAAQKLQAEQDEKRTQQQSSLSKQLLDRSQGLANGGKIEGKGTGKSDSITAKIKENSFVIPSENSATAETIRKVVLKAPIVKANLKQGGGEKVKLSNGEHLFTPKEVKKVAEAGIDLQTLAPNAKNQLPGDKQKLTNQKELLGFKDGNLADAMKEGNKTAPKKTVTPKYYSKKATAEKITPDYLESINPNANLIAEKENTYMGQPVETNDLYKNRTPEELMVETKPTVTSTGGLAGKFDVNNIGNIAESAIPFLQAGYGLSQLRKQGKRPVGELDKDYLKSIDSARTNLDLANAQAKYGFTPEESALLSQENQNLTNAQRYAARNLSGGSAGNAFNLERSAINNSFGRGLKAAVENRNLMLQKQGIAGDKQAYLDNLIANKANMSRTLFNDKMNAFEQNQRAGSGLLSAGIKNMVGNHRYNAELDAMKNASNMENAWMNKI